jgi:hypothetical protein
MSMAATVIMHPTVMAMVMVMTTLCTSRIVCSIATKNTMMMMVLVTGMKRPSHVC